MKKKNIIYTIIFIILILTTIFLTYQLIVLKKTNENIEKNYFNLKVNGLINNTTNNVLNNTVNNIIANNVTNTINSEVVNNEAVQTNLSNTEKAIKIAKDDWGTDSTVYFSYDHIDTSTGKYVICVRDKKTTHAQCWYYIDISTGKFTKEL